MDQFGKTVIGNDISYLKIGFGSNKVLYSASFHANEWICSAILIKFLEEICHSYVLNSSIYGINTKYIFNNASIYIVPMVNPDGVDLVTGYLKPENPNYENCKIISNAYPNFPFPSGWKANIRGVDLKNYQPFSQSLVFV